MISKMSLWATKNCVVIDIEEILASMSNLIGLLLPMRAAKPPSLSKTGIGGGDLSTISFSRGLRTDLILYANITK